MRRASKTCPRPPAAVIKFIVCISEICRPLKSVPHVTLAPQTWKTASECCTTAFANHPQAVQNPAREKSRRKTSFWRTSQSGNMVYRLAFNLDHKNPIFPKNKCNIFHMILFSIRSKVDNVAPYRQECIWAHTLLWLWQEGTEWFSCEEITPPSFNCIWRSALRVRFKHVNSPGDICHTPAGAHILLSPCENNSLHTGQSVTFISISHPPWGFWTTSQSITAMQIQPPLTIQIMIRWSSDFINTLCLYITSHELGRLAAPTCDVCDGPFKWMDGRYE